MSSAIRFQEICAVPTRIPVVVWLSNRAIESRVPDSSDSSASCIDRAISLIEAKNPGANRAPCHVPRDAMGTVLAWHQHGKLSRPKTKQHIPITVTSLRYGYRSMDRYKASIESVDSALNRLNQTLASYKLLLSESSQSSPATPAESNAAPQKAVSTTQHTTGTTPRKLEIDGVNERSSLQAEAQATSPHNLPEEGLIDDLLRSLRSSHRYPEVRTPPSKAIKGSAGSSSR